MFSSYERMLMSLTLRNRLPTGQNMGYLDTETTLWSDCPLGIVSQGETIWRPSTLVSSSFRRPYTEVGIPLYVLTERVSTTGTNFIIAVIPSRAVILFRIVQY
jgi:hypothetical protein